MSIFKNKGGNFKFIADYDKCVNLFQTILFSEEVNKNSVARGSTLPPWHTRQSSRLLVMFPLPWRHTSPWFTLSEKIFTLPPFIDFMYKVREPAEVHQLILLFCGGAGLVLCVLDSQGVSPGLTPLIWYQKWTHSVLALPLWTGEARNPLAPAGRRFAPVFAIM